MKSELKFSDNSFDIISIFAAVDVMLAHCLAWVFQNGDGGVFRFWRFIAPGPAVAIMFAMSGYLVIASYERSDNLHDFAFKRIVRIYPALIVVVIVPLVFYSVNNLIQLDFFDEVLFFLKEVIYAGGGTIGRPDTAIGNGSLWTIWRQVQFYILTPLIYRCFKKCRILVQGFIIILFVAVNLWTPSILSALSGSMRSIYGISCLPYLYIYLLGCFCYINRKKLIPILRRILPLTIVLYGIVHWGIDLDSRFNWYYINPISAILVIMVLFGVAYSFGKHRVRIDISYGIYLWHMAVLDVLVVVYGLQKSSVSLFVATVFITIIMAILSAVLVERPAMKLIRR